LHDFALSRREKLSSGSLRKTEKTQVCDKPAQTPGVAGSIKALRFSKTLLEVALSITSIWTRCSAFT
jgi:hypothetical protein